MKRLSVNEKEMEMEWIETRILEMMKYDDAGTSVYTEFRSWADC